MYYLKRFRGTKFRFLIRQGTETEIARRVEWAEPALAPEKGGDPRQWGGPAQSSSTRRAPITKSSTSRTVLFHIKRFPRTKQVFKPLSYHLKRFRGTKFRFISDSGKATEKRNRESNREKKQGKQQGKVRWKKSGMNARRGVTCESVRLYKSGEKIRMKSDAWETECRKTGREKTVQQSKTEKSDRDKPGSQTEQKTEQSGKSGLFCHYVDVNMC